MRLKDRTVWRTHTGTCVPLGCNRPDRPDTAGSPRRCAIAAAVHTQLDLFNAYAGEDPVLQAARDAATELGLEPVPPGIGATLRLLAAAGQARAVVEIGTGTGVSGVWLLGGMRPDGVLTTIDLEPKYQRVARQVFLAAGVPAGRTRIISGPGVQVLARLTDAAYDLLFADADPVDHADYLFAAARVLRPGGVLVLHGGFTPARLQEPTVHDQVTVATRDLLRDLRESEDWVPALLPTGDGLLCAVKAG